MTDPSGDAGSSKPAVPQTQLPAEPGVAAPPVHAAVTPYAPAPPGAAAAVGGYPQAFGGAPYSGAPYPGAPNFTVNVAPQAIVIAPPSGPGIGVRVIWYVFIGWWLTGLVILTAYLAAITVIGLPLTFYLVNRIPTALTLRPRTKTYAATDANGVTTLTAVNLEQRPMWQRALWFVFVGWWLGGLWMGLAYVLCLIVIGLPFGIMMFDRTGGIMTLHRH